MTAQPSLFDAVAAPAARRRAPVEPDDVFVELKSRARERWRIVEHRRTCGWAMRSLDDGRWKYRTTEELLNGDFWERVDA